MNEPLRVLQIEDSASDAALIVRYLERTFGEVHAERVEDEDSTRAALVSKVWDVVIADYYLPQFGAAAALRILQESGHDIPFLVVSGTMGEEEAVAIMKSGAHDYLLKHYLARLAPAVEREIRESRVRRERKQAEEDRRRSEQRYYSLFHNMQNGFAYCKMLYDEHNQPVDYIPLEVNQAFERLTGLSGVVGKPVTESIPGIRESYPELFEIQGRVASTGQPESFELDFRPVGRWFSISVYSLERGYFAAILEDITARKRHADDQEAMMTLLRLLNAPNDTRELSRTVTSLLQEWSPCESVGIRLRAGNEFSHYESRGIPPEFVEGSHHACVPQIDCMCGNVLNGNVDSRQPFFTTAGSFWTNDSAASAPNPAGSGSNISCRLDGFPSVALIPLRSSGRTLGLLEFKDRRPDRFTPERIARMERAAGSLAIALEQRRTQDALRASEEKYRLISENTADVIWLLDVDSSRYVYVSPSVQRMLGYTPDEMMAADVNLTLPPESRELAARRMTEVVAAFHSGETVQGNVEQFDQARKDGSIVRTEVSATMLRNRAGRIEVLGVTRDITERMQAEARWMQAQKLESVGRLAGGVAHDFNNLLTVINGYSNMLMQDLPADDPMRESVSEIGLAGERAAALTGQLLMLSRKQVVRPRSVNLNDVILEVQKMLGRVIGEDIRLESVLSPALGCVLADPGQLHQILMNLAVNARDAMPDGGRLMIETANVHLSDDDVDQHPDLRPGSYIRLKVGDTGVGMTAEVLSHLFEPFFTTKQPGEGTGLGLATVYGIVKQCGGSISVESEPGKGTRFAIYLPERQPATSPPKTSKPDSAALRGTETILVVEDQEQLRRLVGRVLRSHGYNVHEAGSAGEALLLAGRHQGPIHLLITDVVMPDISGPELARRMKPLRPDTRILYMSGHTDRALVDLQTAAYISKPFAPESLAVKVREVLGSRRSEKTILVADDEALVRNLLRTILDGAGYQVLLARNGKEAVRQVESSKVDLVITDLAMPDQEGLETISQLHRRRPELKIIAMSGQFAGPLLSASEFLGARASLPKPIQPEVLLETVARLLAGV